MNSRQRMFTALEHKEPDRVPYDLGSGPMTGITTRSMAVLVVENRAFGNRAFCTLNEGAGNVMRFGGGAASISTERQVDEWHDDRKNIPRNSTSMATEGWYSECPRG